MNREEKLSRIVEVESFLTGLIVKGRLNGEPYRPSTDDEYQHLRDEISQLRKEVFKPKEEKKSKSKSKKKSDRPSASVTCD